MKKKPELVYVVDPNLYFTSIDCLVDKLPKDGSKLDFDCIVSLKRSGFMMGVYISNKLRIPMFTVQEIPSIPKDKFSKILVLDDKSDKGKSLNKVINKLTNYGFPYITTGVLFKQGDYTPNYFLLDFSNGEVQVELFYQNY